ncbi:MAG: CD225/dispanin family protein [Tannerella sp.]|jgi:hypothetical protein|nr:CD225/dispanin family protein [Tannerella sp.]
MEEKNYFYLVGNDKKGPFTLAALANEPITASTLVWNETLPDWVTAGTLPELSGIIGTPAPTYVQQQSAQTPPPTNTQPMPDNYLIWAILVTVFCCLPFGIVSIISSTKVSSAYAMGDYAGAQKASSDAKKWALWGAIIGGVVIVLYIILVFVLGIGAAMLDSSY